MKLTKERKAYAAVLGLGIGALMMDKLFFGGSHLSPGTAAAASPAAPAPDAPPVGIAPPSTDAAPAVGQAPTLAARLEKVRPEVPAGGHPGTPFAPDSLLRTRSEMLLHDPSDAGLFASRADWLSPTSEKTAQAPAPTKETLKDVLGRHKISTIMVGRANSKSTLIVDGKALPEGGDFDGITIVSIGKDAKKKETFVILEWAGQKERVAFRDADGDR